MNTEPGQHGLLLDHSSSAVPARHGGFSENVVDIGIFDPSGKGPGNADHSGPGFRGG